MGGDTNYSQPTMPTYGESLSESLKAQADFLRGTGEFTGTGSLESLLPLEESIRRKTAQADTDILRSTLLGRETGGGTQEVTYDDQGRIVTGSKPAAAYTIKPIVRVNAGKETDYGWKEFPPDDRSRGKGGTQISDMLHRNDGGRVQVELQIVNQDGKILERVESPKEAVGDKWYKAEEMLSDSELSSKLLEKAKRDNPAREPIPEVFLSNFEDNINTSGSYLKSSTATHAAQTVEVGKGSPIYAKDAEGKIIQDPAKAGLTETRTLPVQREEGMIDVLGDKRNVQRAVRQEDGSYVMEDVGRRAGYSEDGEFLGLSALAEDLQAGNLSRQRQRDLEDVARMSPLYKEIMDQYQPGTQEALEAARKVLTDRQGALTGGVDLGAASDLQATAQGLARTTPGSLSTGDAITAPTGTASTRYMTRDVTSRPFTAMTDYTAAQAAAGSPLSRATGYDPSQVAGVAGPEGPTQYTAAETERIGIDAPTSYAAERAAALDPLSAATGYDAATAAQVGIDAPTSYAAERAAAVDPLSAAIAYDASRVGGVRDLSAATQYDPTAVSRVSSLTAPTSYDAIRASAIDPLSAATSYDAIQASAIDPLSAATSYDPSADLDSGRIGGAYEQASGRGTGDIRSALLEDAYTGLDEGLTAREQEQIEQAARRRATALGRAFDRGSIANEVEARVLEDRNRQAQNRAFAQSVLGQEAGMQTSDLGRSLQAQMGNQAARNRAAEFGVQAGMSQEQAQAQFAQQKALADQAAANQAAQYGIGARLQQEQMEAQMAQQKRMADAAAANRAAEFGVESGMRQEQTAVQLEQQRALADAAAANRAAEFGVESGMRQEQTAAQMEQQRAMADAAAANRAAEFGVGAGLERERASTEFAQRKALADQAAANRAAEFGVGAGLDLAQTSAGYAQQRALSDQAAANRAAEFGVGLGVEQERASAQLAQQRALSDQAAANRAAEFGVGAGIDRARAAAELAQQKTLTDAAAANRAAEFGISTGMRQSEIGSQYAQQKALADATAANQAAQFGIGAGLQQEELGAQLAQQRALSDQAAANRAAEFGVGTRVAQEQAWRGMDQAARLANAAAQNRAAELSMQAGLQQQQFAAGQDLAAQAMNREAAIQGSQFDILQDIARQESNIGRELSAAESDLERDYRRKVSQEQLAQQGLLGYMDATTRLAGLESATAQDPFQAILGRTGGGSLQAGQSVFGQAGYGLQSGPQYLNPESGLGFIQNQATNQANMFNAQVGADATRQAGIMNMIGSLGGAVTGTALGKGGFLR